MHRHLSARHGRHVVSTVALAWVSSAGTQCAHLQRGFLDAASFEEAHELELVDVASPRLHDVPHGTHVRGAEAHVQLVAHVPELVDTDAVVPVRVRSDEHVVQVADAIPAARHNVANCLAEPHHRFCASVNLANDVMDNVPWVAA